MGHAQVRQLLLTCRAGSCFHQRTLQAPRAALTTFETRSIAASSLCSDTHDS